MKTVQEIFNGIIEDDLYQSQGYFMCDSLHFAWKHGLITDEERDQCLDEICDFIGPWATLQGMFELRDHRLTKEVRLEIYKNWERRQEIFDDFMRV